MDRHDEDWDRVKALITEVMVVVSEEWHCGFYNCLLSVVVVFFRLSVIPLIHLDLLPPLSDIVVLVCGEQLP